MTRAPLLRAGLLCATFALAAAAAAPAQAQGERALRVLLGAGVTVGGNTLATVDLSDGTRTGVQGGGLVHVYAGAELRLGTLVTLIATAGYHRDDTGTGADGDIRFTRYPVELLAHVAVTERFRVGGGARFIDRARLRGSGVASAVDVRFASTTGAVIEGEYFVTPDVGVKVRAVREEYRPEGGGSRRSGSHVGLYLSGYY